MSMALPLLMGAMKRNTATPEGANGLMGALNNSKHDGSILDNLGGLFNGGVDEEVKNECDKGADVGEIHGDMNKAKFKIILKYSAAFNSIIDNG